MGNAAFELTADYAGTTEIHVTGEDGKPTTREVDTFQGSVIAIPPDGESFDVKQELADGGGLIVVDEANGLLTAALDDLPSLKRVEAPEGAEGISAYSTLSAVRLRELIKARGIDPAGATRKAQFIDLLEASDKARLEGDAEGAANPDPEGAPTGQEG